VSDPTASPPDAEELHRSCLVIDSHNDSAVALIRQGCVGLGGERDRSRRNRAGAVAYLRQYVSGEATMQLDIPQMRAGGIDAAFFAVDTTRAWGNHLLYALDAHGYLKREVRKHTADIVIAESAQDILNAREAGKLAALLAVENSTALERSLYALDALYELGVRTLTITHSARNEAADGCEVEGGSGLTGFGRQVVDRMNELGMLIDVSHLNEQGFWDVLERSTQPVIASHSCCRALCDHPRNLTDEQLRALGAASGVVALTYVPFFIDTEAPSLERLVDHILHAFEVAGESAVGLGSDFDGGGDLLPSASEVPGITVELLARGVDPGTVRAILGGNTLRLLQATIG
jgi:membrane dipeptidase